MAWKWRFRHKLLLGLGLVAAVMALLLAGTMKGLFAYRATMRTIENKLAEMNEIDKVQSEVKALNHPFHKPLYPAMEMDKRLEQTRKALTDYRTLLELNRQNRREARYGQGELALAKILERMLDKLAATIAEATHADIRGPGENPVKLVDKPKVREAIDKLALTVGDLNSTISKDLYDRISRSRNDAKVTIIIVITTTVVSILLMAGLLRWFYRWVFYPIRDLNQGVERVARGDFEHRIAVNSGDEIEDLAKAYNDMTGRLRDMYTDLAHKVNERSRQLVRSERLAGVGFLAAGVAHEINNPLASIAFCSEALESRLADLLAQRRAGAASDQDRDIVAKYLKMIQEEAFRCKEIIQRLLDFSRGGERHREPTDLGDVLQGVLDMVQHLPNSKGKQIHYVPNDTLVPWINAQEIKSVVLNLVVNALDSMDEGGTLTIGQRLHDGMAELTFQDSGCGMTAEILENIFEPFFSRSRTGKGTGLGLSISHRLITQHGGEIEAASAGPNQGSTFTVRLPLGPPAESKEGHSEVLDPETEFSKLAGRPTRRAA